MNFSKRLQAWCIVCCAVAMAHADNTLSLTLINQSDFTLLFERLVAGAGNHFTLSATSLNPGEQIVIIGTTTANADLQGSLFFDKQSRLTIRDQRQFHYGQPVFSMSGPYVTSSFTARPNPVIDPRALKIIEARVVITTKRPPVMAPNHAIGPGGATCHLTALPAIDGNNSR